MEIQLETIQQTAPTNYHHIINQCQSAKTIELFAGGVCIHYHPPAGDAKQAFIEYTLRLARKHPGNRVTSKRAIAARAAMINRRFSRRHIDKRDSSRFRALALPGTTQIFRAASCTVPGARKTCA